MGNGAAGTGGAVCRRSRASDEGDRDGDHRPLLRYARPPVDQGGGPVALLARGRQLIVVGRRGFGAERAKLRAFGLDGAPHLFGNGTTVSAGSLRGEEMAATVQPNGRLILVGERPAEEAAHQLELLGLR